MAKSGDQGNVWIQESVDLNILQGVEASLRFHTETGPSYTSDFCLDDFCFSMGEVVLHYQLNYYILMLN